MRILKRSKARAPSRPPKMKLKNPGARPSGPSVSGTPLINLSILLIRLRTHGSSSARLSAPLPVLASAVSNNPFLPPQKWTLQSDKGQKSGARSERVCLSTSPLSPFSIIRDFQSDLASESQCPEGGVECAKARPPKVARSSEHVREPPLEVSSSSSS